MTNVAVPVPYKDRNTFSVGLLIAFASWTLIFFTLLWGYAVYRLRSSVWLAGYISTEVFGSAMFNTVVLFLSSWMLSSAFKQRTGNPAGKLWSAWMLGMIFLLGQLNLWHGLLSNGLHWNSSQAGSFLFLLTGFHALHVVGGLIALTVLCLKFPSLGSTYFAVGAKRFWDFLLVIWLVMFVLIFILQ